MTTSSVWMSTLLHAGSFSGGLRNWGEVFSHSYSKQKENVIFFRDVWKSHLKPNTLDFQFWLWFILFFIGFYKGIHLLLLFFFISCVCVACLNVCMCLHVCGKIHVCLCRCASWGPSLYCLDILLSYSLHLLYECSISHLNQVLTDPASLACLFACGTFCLCVLCTEIPNKPAHLPRIYMSTGTQPQVLHCKPFTCWAMAIDLLSSILM